MNWIFLFVILPIVTEAITELVGVSGIFSKLREGLSNKSNFFKELFECKYCLSVWSAMFVVTVYFIWVGVTICNLPYYFLVLILTHRLSNLFHYFYDIVRDYKFFRWSIRVNPLEDD